MTCCMIEEAEQCIEGMRHLMKRTVITNGVPQTCRPPSPQRSTPPSQQCRLSDSNPRHVTPRAYVLLTLEEGQCYGKPWRYLNSQYPVINTHTGRRAYSLVTWSQTHRSCSGTGWTPWFELGAPRVSKMGVDVTRPANRQSSLEVWSRL
jgi:hypothetical protein